MGCLVWGRRFPLALLAFSAHVIAAGEKKRRCPPESTLRGLPRPTANEKVSVAFINEANIPVEVFFYQAPGQELPLGEIEPRSEMPQASYVSHTFIFRSAINGRLMQSHTMEPGSRQPLEVSIKGCAGMRKPLAKDPGVSPEPPEEFAHQKRWPEFEALAALGKGRCVGPSKNWSCVRTVASEEVAERDPKEYGFQGDEAAGSPYQVGTTADHIHMQAQRYIPNVTSYEEGYLKMEMPDTIKAVLHPWYEQQVPRRHQPIPGYFTNNHKVVMDIVEIGRSPTVLKAIQKEMQQVMEWWTGMKLEHSTTFGCRIYRRGAMLLNHLDRKDTHIASAILQVGQQGLDEGWPLELIHPHHSGDVKEVYLQPGQLLLYEGARIVHGRPKRLKGEEFANIFTHFKPKNYNGPPRRPNQFFSRPPSKRKRDVTAEL